MSIRLFSYPSHPLRPDKNRKSQSQAWYAFISFSYVCGLSGIGGRAHGLGSQETRAGGTSYHR